MTTERIIRILVGIMILASIGLGIKMNPWWFALAVFVAVNLIQSVFTGICPAEWILRKMGIPSCYEAEKNKPAHTTEGTEHE